MSLILQLIINGLIAGSIYALVACGFSLIYATNRFIHFAHGSCVVVGGYTIFALFASGLNFYLASILTILLSGLFGIALYKFIYLPLQKRKASNIILLIASIGLLILFQNLIQLIFGANVRSIGHIEVTRGIDIFGAAITSLQLIIIAVSALLLVFLYLFIYKTRIGREIRAVSDNKDLARIIGINDRKIAYITFFIGSCLAGVAGILIGLEQNLYHTMGTALIVKGFTGAVIGGLISVPASILGSYILGLAENLGIWFLPSRFKDAIAFILLFLFLLLKPEGLFGIRKGVKG